MKTKVSFLVATMIAAVDSSCLAAEVSFNLCNLYNIGPANVVVKDKKANMAVLYSGAVPRDLCVRINAFSEDGKFADVELTVAQGVPYGVPFISPDSNVNF
jgi:hypothetical protein